jgi:hypothetical protein
MKEKLEEHMGGVSIPIKSATCLLNSWYLDKHNIMPIFFHRVITRTGCSDNLNNKRYRGMINCLNISSVRVMIQGKFKTLII